MRERSVWGYAEYGVFDVPGGEEFGSFVQGELGRVAEQWYGCADCSMMSGVERTLLVRFKEEYSRKAARELMQLGLPLFTVVSGFEQPGQRVSFVGGWVQEKQKVIARGGEVGTRCEFVGTPFVVKGKPELEVESRVVLGLVIGIRCGYGYCAYWK